MKKCITKFPLLFLLSLCIGCGGDDSKDISPADLLAKQVKVLDFQNNGNSSDIKLSFIKPNNPEFVNTFRIIICKSSSSDSFTGQDAIQLSESSYHEIEPNSSPNGIELRENMTDSDGDLIVEEESYKAFVFSKGVDHDDTLSTGSPSFTLTQTNLVSTLAQVSGGSGGLAVDNTGNIYMGDFGADLSGNGTRVFKITREGSVSVFANGLLGASGNDFDSNGNLYQSNKDVPSISKITPDGVVSTFSDDSNIINPIGIYIDDNDDLYVADCEGYRVLKIDQNGDAVIFSNSSLLNCPNGITMDDSGNLYVTNFYDGNIIKITSGGTASVFASLPKGQTQNGNNGHITFHNGSLYAIARAANQIYKVSLSGSFELFAGSGMRGSADGSALDASFSLPNDLVFSPDGTKLYINDVVPTDGALNVISPCHIRVIDIVE